MFSLEEQNKTNARPLQGHKNNFLYARAVLKILFSSTLFTASRLL